MSTARSMPESSMCFRKAFGERQYSSMRANCAPRLAFMSASASGLNSSSGWIWMWQSVIIGLGSIVGSRWPRPETPWYQGGNAASILVKRLAKFGAKQPLLPADAQSCARVINECGDADHFVSEPPCAERHARAQLQPPHRGV